ncbi:MAG: iron-siderophore ABC transporter substrate-binding protein [Treponema sp.]|jgi:iron complex transport system substrate-binding protein|nr:iron-siderophore ABC transporter substrate-binding protein [Treponema sp.]
MKKNNTDLWFKRVVKAFLVLVVCILVPVGCSRTQTPPASAAPAVEEPAVEAYSSGYPIVIQHAFGETVIKSKPERVVTIGWGNQDIPLALGVVPVGFSEANYGVLDDSGLLPWTAERLQELGGSGALIFGDRSGLDFEAINEVKPDVILASYSGITQEEYQTLSEIAPVVAYPRAPYQTLWREQILINATGMGMAEEGERLVEDLEALIAEKTAQYPQIAGKTAAFLYLDAADLSTISAYTPADPRTAFLTDIGMPLPASIAALVEGSDNFYLTISSENADMISDIDIIFTYAAGSNFTERIEGNEFLKQLQNDPLIGTIPAVQRGSIIFLEEGPIAASTTPSALSIPWAIDEYLALTAEAADKIK